MTKKSQQHKEKCEACQRLRVVDADGLCHGCYSMSPPAAKHPWVPKQK